MAADTLGRLLAAHVTPADEQDRTHLERLAAAVQDATGEGVGVAHVDQGHAGEGPAAAASGRRWSGTPRPSAAWPVLRPAEPDRGVLLPQRRVAERGFAWAARPRRPARDYERLPRTLAGLHFLAFVRHMVQKAAPLLASGP